MKAEPGWHEVCFGDVIDFDTPNCQTVLVEVGQTTFVEGMFQHRGWLRVVTDLPHDSVIYANGVPRNNWGMWVDLPLGTYEVCFGESDGFTPPCETVAVADGVTTLVTGTWP